MSALISCRNFIVRGLGAAAAVLLRVISFNIILACYRAQRERMANVRVWEQVEQARHPFARHEWGQAEIVL